MGHMVGKGVVDGVTQGKDLWWSQSERMQEESNT